MKQNNIKIAVTGGIGSGKSLALGIIKSKGYPVFSCDEIYKELLNGGVLPEILAGNFGREILNADGTLNRKALSSIVFSDEKKLQKLNEITHPEIFNEIFSRAENCEGLVFIEVPLLFEGGYQKLFDKIVVIERDEEQRILSVVKRDKLSREEVQKRISKQQKYDNIDFAKYYVIHNDGRYDDFIAKINELLSVLTA